MTVDPLRMIADGVRKFMPELWQAAIERVADESDMTPAEVEEAIERHRREKRNESDG